MNKTFLEEFKNYRENYTLEKLFLEETFSLKRRKRDKFLLIPLFLLIVGVLFVYFEWSRIFGVSIFLLSILSMFFYIYKKIIVMAKRELKSKKLPFSKRFLEWKSEELEIQRMQELYKIYENISTNNIQKRIEYAELLVANFNKDILADFEKISEFFLKNYILLLVGLLIGIFNRTQYTDENFRIILNTIIWIFGLAYFMALFWKYFFKKNLLDSFNSKHDQYKEYILTMKNILLMRE